MSSEVTTVTVARSYRQKTRPDITLAGKVYKARTKLANKYDITDRSAARRNWRTVYIGGVAYCSEEDSDADFIHQVRRRNEPLKRKRG
jgi:hypothetical protein